MQSAAIPTMMLTLLGAVIAVLGFFGGGNLAWTTLGIGAIAVAGVLSLLDRRIPHA